MSMGLVTNDTDLRRKSFPRTAWIPIEQGLNAVVLLLKKRPDLHLLLWSEFKIICKVIQLLIDGPRSVDRRLRYTLCESKPDDCASYGAS